MLELDTETFSTIDISSGLYRYSEAVEVMLLAWAVDEGDVQVLDFTRGDTLPAQLEDALLGECEIHAHNAPFDRRVIANTPHRALVHASHALDRWHCSMVQAYLHGLPGSLGQLCDIYKVDANAAKIKEGHELVMRFCKPRPKNEKLRRHTRETHPKEWARFVEYAGRDILAMRDVRKRMPKWNLTPMERALWIHDQRCNTRGMMIDVPFVHAAIEAVTREQNRLRGVAQDLTLGAIDSTTQRDRLLTFINEVYDLQLPDLTGDTVERALAAEIPDSLRQLLNVRVAATTSSTAKYKALQRAVSSDGRLRGTLQFAGASRTGRDAGRVFQPQNLPRPTMKHDAVEAGIRAIKAGGYDLIADDTMAMASNALRGVIIAPPGRKLVVSDLANIEGRVAAWLAGETWKLDAFRAYDAGTAPDLYCVAYGRAFGVDPATVVGLQRQIGKVSELMLQYQGGVGAYITGAATYGIDLDKMADAALPAIPIDVVEEAEKFLEWCREMNRPLYGLSPRVFTACDSLKRLWRRQHPGIVSLWRALEDGVRDVMSGALKVATPAGLRITRNGSWLRIQLPSGRMLCYPSCRVGKFRRNPEDEESTSDTITYMGLSPYSKKWTRLATYGGKLFENIVQAASRDVLFAPIPMIENYGYEIVLRVHDELVTETPDDDDHNPEHLSELMCEPQDWHIGLPLSAKGFQGYRYRKD